jgi:outer membrane protein TolC
MFSIDSFMTKKRMFLILSFSIAIISVRAQEQQNEALETFSLREFFEIILANHPIVGQANLLSEQARQEIRIARGGFDPRIDSYYARKRFGGVDYYDIWNSSVRIPIWFNTDIRLGYETNSGLYLNRQNVVPEPGLIYGGISLPIGQGLIIDARRALLRQAQEMEGMLEADRVRLINRTLLNATRDYWDWYFAYNQLRLLREAQELAEVRYRGIVEGVIVGDQAPIDSVEALIIVQNRDINLQQAIVGFQNATIILSNHLWNQDNIPLELKPGTIPVDHATLLRINEVDLEALLSNAKSNHPDLVRIHHEIRQVEIERRMNREMLRPVLNLNYNFLNQPAIATEEFNGAFFANNYTLGVTFSFPIFLRQERGRLERTNIRLMSMTFGRDLRQREIMNSVLAEYNEARTTAELITRQERLVRNNEILLEGEIARFEAGESSVFLVNARETNLIDSRSRLLSLQTRYEKAKAALLWAAGVENLGGWQ